MLPRTSPNVCHFQPTQHRIHKPHYRCLRTNHQQQSNRCKSQSHVYNETHRARENPANKTISGCALKRATLRRKEVAYLLWHPKDICHTALIYAIDLICICMRASTYMPRDLLLRGRNPPSPMSEPIIINGSRQLAVQRGLKGIRDDGLADRFSDDDDVQQLQQVPRSSQDPLLLLLKGQIIDVEAASWFQFSFLPPLAVRTTPKGSAKKSGQLVRDRYAAFHRLFMNSPGMPSRADACRRAEDRGQFREGLQREGRVGKIIRRQ